MRRPLGPGDFPPAPPAGPARRRLRDRVTLRAVALALVAGGVVTCLVPLGLVGVESEDNVGMSQLGGGLDFAVKALDRGRMFEPFQRLGDQDATTGVGLGLAVARGFVEAVGGTLTATDTPGGGLTMTIALPAVATVRAVPS